MTVTPLQIRSYSHAPQPGFTAFGATILRAGHVRTVPGAGIRRERYPGVDVLFCLSGRGFVLLQNREYPVAGGEIAWLANARPHGHRPHPVEPWELLWFRLDGPEGEALMAARFGQNEHVRAVPDCSRLQGWFNDLFAVLDHGGADIDWRLNQLVARFLMLLSPAAHDRPPIVPDAVSKAIAAMSEGLAEPWREHELAAAAGVSATHLRRLFGRHVGRSPRRFLIEARIREVQRLLGDTHLPIADIAAAVGFSDVFHLGREFKRVTGQSPARWRRNEKFI